MTAKPRVVIAGGGVAALEALLTLRELAPARLDVTLVAPEEEFTYRPLAVGEPFGLTEPRRLPLDGIAAEHGARFRRAAVGRVESAERRVLLRGGGAIPYDALLVCVGARPVPERGEQLMFRGPQDVPAMRALLADVAAGRVARLAFAAPADAGWELPIYELALMTAAHAERARRRPSLSVMTTETAPLEIFGAAASAAVAAELEAAGIEFVSLAGRNGSGEVSRRFRADRVVALPRLVGPDLHGLPRDRDGFVLTDALGCVPGLDATFAAGDGIAFAVKQGGLAAQQADAAAESLAAWAGIEIDPCPFRPVLRGLLLTGAPPTYLRTGGTNATSEASEHALWWPPAKIVGRRLAPYLASCDPFLAAPPDGAGVPVELALTAQPAIRRLRESLGGSPRPSFPGPSS